MSWPRPNEFTQLPRPNGAACRPKQDGSPDDHAGYGPPDERVESGVRLGDQFGKTGRFGLGVCSGIACRRRLAGVGGHQEQQATAVADGRGLVGLGFFEGGLITVPVGMGLAVAGSGSADLCRIGSRYWSASAAPLTALRQLPRTKGRSW
jgi:hypothetical protein